MSLQIWLPLNGNSYNQGLSNITMTDKNITVNNSGKIGKCYQFNNTSSISYSPELNITATKMSISCWAYIDSPATSSGYICGLSLANGAGFQLYYYNVDKVLRLYANAGSRGTYDVTSYLNAWHHYTLTTDGSKLYLYIDGKQPNDFTPISYTMSGLGSCYFYVGARRSGSDGSGNGFFKGRLNDVRFYDHCLSPKEVEEIAKGLVLHYKLDNVAPIGNPNLIPSNKITFGTTEQWTGTGWATECINHTNLMTILQPSTTYTFSFTGEIIEKTSISNPIGTSGSRIGFLFYSPSTSSANFAINKPNFYTLNEPFSLSITFTTPDTIPDDYKLIYYTNRYSTNGGSPYGNDVVKFSNIKLELGDTATEWCPYSSDTLYNVLYPTTIYDCSGYRNNGTIVGSLGAAAGSPRYGAVTKFSGSQYVEAEPLPTETKTLSAWINFNSIPPSSYTIPLHDKVSGLAIGITGGNRLISYVGSAAGGTGSCVNVSLSTNTWYHIVVVETGSTTRDVYIDGTKITSIAGNNWWGGDLDKFNIGCRHISGSYANYFNGKMSDIRAYATALTAAQVTELYNTSMSVDSSGNIHARELVEL